MCMHIFTLHTTLKTLFQVFHVYTSFATKQSVSIKLSMN